MAKKNVMAAVRPQAITIAVPGQGKELRVVDVVRLPAPAIGKHFPVPIAQLGNKGKKRFTTFFTDNIRNVNTRQAYFRAAFQFFGWCDEHGLEFTSIQSYHVSAYIEQLLEIKSKSTAKQHLAAIRMLYDWLIVGQIIEVNPAHTVRDPKHVVTVGTTPILDTDQMALLIGTIDVSTVVGLRDRALIAAMTATFGRIEASLMMNVADYFDDGKCWSIKLHEKNGKTIVMPVQHKLEEYLDAYIEAAGGVEEFPFELGKNGRPTKRQPLFRSTRGRSGLLTENRMSRQDAWRMIKRRCKAAGINGKICNHSFRGTGITNYLENGGTITEAQRMAGHSDTRTTGLYDRRNQKITRGEVEKISILG